MLRPDAGCVKEEDVKRYEYTFFEKTLSAAEEPKPELEMLNELGKSGWEVIERKLSNFWWKDSKAYRTISVFAKREVTAT